MSLKILYAINFITLAIVLVGCSDSEELHHSEPSKAELVRIERLAAEGDSDAIDKMVSRGSFEDDVWKTKLWADRLSWKNDVSGFEMSAYSRYEIAENLDLDDPERLALLIEAKEFGRRAIESRPGIKPIYVGRGGLFESFDREIKRSRDGLQKKYGIVKPLEPHERKSEFLKSKGVK